MNIEDLVKNFLNEYDNVNTRRNYLKVLKIYFQYLEENDLRISCTPNKIRIFIKQLKSKLKSATINNYMTIISKFYNWLIGEKILNDNPFWSIKKERIKNKKPKKELNREYVLELFKKSKNIDKFILYFLFFHAMRRSEISNIKLEDLKLDKDPKIIIRGKGGYVREHPIQEWMVEDLREFSQRKVNYLFESKRKLGYPIDPSTIYRRFRKLGKKIGIDINPHMSRHYTITKLLSDGESILKVMRFAGHKKIDTTLIYDKQSDDIKDSPIKEFKI